MTAGGAARGEIPAIELIDIHTELGGTRVLRGVSFAVPRERITVLLGPSGVGKTTCLRHIVGLLPPDRGDVLVEGVSTLTMRKAQRLALSRRFGVLLQGSGLYGSALWESLTVQENLLHQLRAQRDWDEQRLQERTYDRLREVGLAASSELAPAALSAGMRRRLALARALVADPEFAVLDSFELGVDVVRLTGLCELIRRHHQRLGGTFLIATQDMDVARRLADDVIVLWGGGVIQQGPAEEVLSSTIPEVAQLLSGSVEGPLGFAGEVPAEARPITPPSRHIEEGFELPIPLVALILLVVITGSALVLGGGNLREVVVVIVVWAVVGLLVALRLRAQSNRRRP